MQEEKSLFGVDVNGEGAASIRRIYDIIRLVFVLEMIAQVLILLYTGKKFISYQGLSVLNDHFYFWYLRIYSMYALVFFFITLLHILYFFEFAKQAKRSIETGDSHKFNQSFTWLYKALRVTVAGIVLNLAYFIYLLAVKR
jgi:hypothetical protein